jgi:hypothetical protein
MLAYWRLRLLSLLAYCLFLLSLQSDPTGSQFKGESGQRFAVMPDNTTLVERNDCEIQLKHGISDWVTWVVFVFFVVAMSMYLQAREIRFDEDRLTASDYSVTVKNPPPDAYDPEQWRDFFSQFADKSVTLVCIHLNNEVMLEKLTQRRVHRDHLRRLLPKGTDMDDEDIVRAAVDEHIRQRDSEPKGCFGAFLECSIFRLLRLFGMFEPAETLLEHYYCLTDEIKELQKEKYEVSKVFVTFETEEGQRAALTALTASTLDVITNNTQNAPPSAVFRGRVLKVVEPTEPDAVRWLDLSATKLYRTASVIITFALTVGFIALAAYLEDLTRQEWGPRFSGPLVTIFNAG